MKALLIAALLCETASVAAAQTGTVIWTPDGGYYCKADGPFATCTTPTQAEIDAHKPKPQLTCPKYQHVDHWPGRCGPNPCVLGSDDNFLSSCNAICTAPPPDRCVDDLHIVTEREWQDLQNRLRITYVDPVKETQLNNELLRLNKVPCVPFDYNKWTETNNGKNRWLCLLPGDSTSINTTDGAVLGTEIVPELPKKHPDSDSVYDWVKVLQR